MTTHPYIRAYLAGVAVPSVFLLFVFVAFCAIRFTYDPAFPLERVLVFPLALVPAFWGLWNVLYQALRKRQYLPLGCHGAIVPLILGPAGLALAHGSGLDSALAVTWTMVAVAAPLAMIVYYLVWKLVVGFLNELLGIG